MMMHVLKVYSQSKFLSPVEWQNFEINHFTAENVYHGNMLREHAKSHRSKWMHSNCTGNVHILHWIHSEKIISLVTNAHELWHVFHHTFKFSWMLDHDKCFYETVKIVIFEIYFSKMHLTWFAFTQLVNDSDARSGNE